MALASLALSLVLLVLGLMISPAAVLNLISARAGISVSPGIAYGSGPRHTLDVYAPQGASGRPVVVFFYGGSWQQGEKATYRFVGAELARRGFVTVVPDYTVYPQGRYPQFLEDGANAVAWIKANAARFGGDPGQLFIMGHSAGAYIAAMLAIDARWLGAVDLDPRKDVRGLIGLAGPYDFLPIEDPVIKIIFGTDTSSRTQPITFVTGGEAPAFLGYATSDTTVRPGNSQRLAAKLEAHGSRVTLSPYANTSHLTLIGAMSPALSFLAPVARDIASFIDTTAAVKR